MMIEAEAITPEVLQRNICRGSDVDISFVYITSTDVVMMFAYKMEEFSILSFLLLPIFLLRFVQKYTDPVNQIE